MKEPTKTQRRGKRAEADRQLDEALEESFPASDPPSTTPTAAGGPEQPSKPSRGRKAEERG
jgi:hypothetical protein